MVNIANVGGLLVNVVNVSRSEFEKNAKSFVFLYFCIYMAVGASRAGNRPVMKGFTELL
jgi:hypothetical protein